jgi:clan AA aspartic protease
MIKGQVANQEMRLEIELVGPLLAAQRSEAVIDTGFNGELTLPSSIVSALQLPSAGNRLGKLADGSVIRLDMYLVTVAWHGRQTDVVASEATGVPLVGMSLLRGSRLTADIIDGGDVLIEELPQRP